MSQAEYASKRLPVLTRLAMALRQIPAVEFAFAKIRALLGGRTGTEPVIASEFLPQASDVASDSATSDDTGADTVETDTLTGPPAGTDSADADAVVTDTVETKTVEPPSVEIDTDEAVIVPADDVASPVAEPDDVSGIATDPIEPFTLPPASVEVDSVQVDTVVTETVETKITEPSAVEIETVEAITAPADDDASREPEPDAVSVADPVEAVALVPDPIATEPVEADAVATDTAEAEPVDSLGEIDTAEAAVVPADDVVLPATKPDDLSEREVLIRRRWKETGIRMWNGAGSVLCIQGRIELLPPKPGETMPQYDRLEFRLIEGSIVCEGFVVDPPEPRHRAFAQISLG